MLPSDNGPPPGAIQQPTMVTPTVISSTVLDLVSWWLGSKGNQVAVRELVVCHFKSEDIFAAWAKLREACQLAAGQNVQVPTKHRSEVKLAEELVKEVYESDKNGTVSLLIPPSPTGSS